MTEDQIRDMIKRLIEREGGFVDHPNDVGGCTKYGVIRATLQDHRRALVTCADVRALTLDEAVAIYRRAWFDHSRLRLSQWPYPTLAEVTLDASIMFSLGRQMAARWAQEAINDQRPKGQGIVTDGWAGPATLAAMVLCDERRLVAGVVARRLRKHARVVARAPSQAVFLEGWVNRATKWIMG